MGHKSKTRPESMEGNQNAAVVKTPEEMIILFDKFCDHLRKGLSKECFPDCDYRTIEKYIKENPTVLQAEKYTVAKRMGQLLWESIGLNGALGMKSVKLADGKELKLSGFNAVAWIFNMKNRYGWHDKQDITSGGRHIATPPSVGIVNPHRDGQEPDSEGV